MLSGKTCLVTGSTAGIGKAIARLFLAQGAFVIINGRNTETIQSVVREFQSLGLNNVTGITADLSSKDGCDKLIREVVQSDRQVDVLVNNMGIFETIDFFEADDEKWLTYFNTNVMSTVRCCRHFLKEMLHRNQGRIIIVSSEAGVRPIPDMIPYCATKSTQINIARGLAELTKGTKVTVNSLLPGPTETEGVRDFIVGIADSTGRSVSEATTGYFVDREPTSLIQRFLTVDEVANVAAFLASDLSSGINGAAQLVEGGIIRKI
jgi:NAD(P)-dependent dehydrogenase (short-subunit alcohol dehydrogenase family)